jgi:hypothetical protein
MGTKCSREAPLSTPLVLNRNTGGYWTNILGGNDAFLVAPAEAGAHASWQGWIPAFAESTPRIEKKCSGGNDGVRGE